MIPVLQSLYTYANEKLIPAYLVGTGYRICEAVIENKEAELRQLLPTEGQELLERYYAAVMEYGDILAEAAFQAGLSIGLELSRQ